MSNDNQETVADVVAEKEAEIARLEAALVALASNDELAKLLGIDAAQQNNRESPGAGRGMPSTAKRGSESGRTPPSRESVAQEGRRSNTGK